MAVEMPRMQEGALSRKKRANATCKVEYRRARKRGRDREEKERGERLSPCGRQKAIAVRKVKGYRLGEGERLSQHGEGGRLSLCALSIERRSTGSAPRRFCQRCVARLMFATVFFPTYRDVSHSGLHQLPPTLTFHRVFKLHLRPINRSLSLSFSVFPLALTPYASTMPSPWEAFGAKATT
ncbi:hypothetical protein AMTR_s00052p00150830 [Amborella trichopoda]|uniref:Uncharacterized protein n=1 Tax=Amborella trichopoda TaxID=13333 RepID=U5D2D3_AMBTC|nr:hypothetical protein AMTR_s00052p00150830 [Amborella trichopoda]